LDAIQFAFPKEIPKEVVKYYVDGGIYQRGESGKETYMGRRIPMEYQYFGQLLKSWRKDCHKLRDIILTESTKKRLRKTIRKGEKQELPENLMQDLKELGYLR
jgi:hypothetical protein